MGGRGASAGLGGGGGFAALNTAFQNQQNAQKNNGGLEGVYQPGYDDNGNPQVVKFQGQDDDKTARFLAKVNNDVNPDDYSDGYAYYPGSYQKFALAMGLDAKPQVLPDKQFDQLVSQNNLQVLYRGESGQAACDRFMNATHSHTGIGSYGDGFYFTEDTYTANSYAVYKGGANGRVLKMALSPSARIITYADLQNKMSRMSGKLQSNLGRAGRADKTKYLNDGEAQAALKLGYNVVTLGSGYHYALTRDAFIVSDTTKHQY